MSTAKLVRWLALQVTLLFFKSTSVLTPLLDHQLVVTFQYTHDAEGLNFTVWEDLGS